MLPVLFETSKPSSSPVWVSVSGLIDLLFSAAAFSSLVRRSVIRRTGCSFMAVMARGASQPASDCLMRRWRLSWDLTGVPEKSSSFSSSSSEVLMA